MREILFRGKRVDNGEWIEGWYGKKSFGAWPLRDAITPCVDAGNGYLHYEEIIPETVGQYTGLNANGKRIFEGDIVKGYNTFHYREEQYIVRYKVIGFFFCENENEWHPDHIEEMRVIGNIHDNPDLIGGKEE